MKKLIILIMMFGSVYSQCLGDMNEDGIKDILDIVNLVNDILDGDDVCEDLDPYGCTVPDACNFDPFATIFDDSCDYVTCAGCDGIPNSGLELDECGVCDGDGSIGDCGCGVELWGEYYGIAITTDINLWGQGLTGSIPLEIECLTNLTNLDLHANQFSGEIPPEIGNLTNLTYLDLSVNQLTGELPSSIGNLTNLTHLILAVNQLTGEIPAEVCNLIESNNLYIDLITSENNLINTCEEAVDICDGLTEVELWGECYNIESTTMISLTGNGLTGQIPPEIGNLMNLIDLMIINSQEKYL